MALNTGRYNANKVYDEEPDSADERLQSYYKNEEIDIKYGFERHEASRERTGWLVNMHAGETLDEDKRLISSVDYYFVEEDGGRFKVSLPFRPYFYVATTHGHEREVSSYLAKRFSGTVASVDYVNKEDLDLPNHLVGLKRPYLKLSFQSMNDLSKVKRELMPRIRKNMGITRGNRPNAHKGFDKTEFQKDQMDYVTDIREHDVPYHVRVAIDVSIFVGHWYTVKGNPNRPPEIKLFPDMIDRPDPVVLAFDIETTKLPLKFPDSAFDQIMMISYMIDGQGYLIVNREIVAADVEDFEYTPRPEFSGPFIVFNEENEKATIERFYSHILDEKPHIIVTYNGDFFDWPFMEARTNFHGMDMFREIGFTKVQAGKDAEYKSRPCIHMDAFKWVKRDSYLPVGSQNLKATTRAKLHYDPVELDPEEMCRMAAEQPQVLASYSVSDAVATYYLYMKYVHPFIFALCTIIPLEPDEVLRKGSGTLCEALLMVEAFRANVIFPNKQETVFNKMTDDGHLLDSETYVGGHVEALESGIFRADIQYKYRLDPTAYKELHDDVERTMKHALEVEEGILMDTVTNFQEVCDEIKSKLRSIEDCPSRTEFPVIYHLDVAAMYPNIILTNRLQPPAIVNSIVCAACEFNKPGARCQRTMEWMWRGEIVPAGRNEYQRIVQQLENEKFPPQFPNGPPRAFHHLGREEQATYEKKRLHEYCKKAYKRIHDSKTEKRETTVCQRENSFYVDTVRAFRDRRYEFKGLLKTWKKKLAEALESCDAAAIKSARSKEVLYDSLQLAHKCILNSFYGYVMRRGSRWFSMEMAGIVCYTGANIITKARHLIEKIGRPLELDTDGIWCMLPASFPENFSFSTKDSKKPAVVVSYPGAMLNVMVKDDFTNNQYHELVDKNTLKYKVRCENSIFFEVDGPYLAMILPSAKEEGKKLKKRYAVFNFDGSLAELKGFEVKRRGELQLIKNFQSSVFESFLKGTTLEEAYQSVAKVADYWLDVLYSKAANMPDSELFDLVSENRSMSRKLVDYGDQKSTAISTARRLAEFLGDQMVKDAGLNCQNVIARKPEGSPVTERAIPLAIFQASATTRKYFLRKWLKLSGSAELDIREILDWQYYAERLGSTIQKIITIPAAMQGIANPVPRVSHPEWLHKCLLKKNDPLKQKRINEIFSKVAKETVDNSENRTKDNIEIMDVEDTCTGDDPDQLGRDSRPAIVTKASNEERGLSKRNREPEADFSKPWRDALGNPPRMGKDKESVDRWVEFQSKKWTYMKQQRAALRTLRQKRVNNDRGDRGIRSGGGSGRMTESVGPLRSMGAYVKRSGHALLNSPWQILQIAETAEPGLFRLWALVDTELRQLNVRVPRVFYMNSKVPKTDSDKEPTDFSAESIKCYRKVFRTLPRSNPVHHLYEYRFPEDQYQMRINQLNAELSVPEIEGIYETQVPMLFRVLMRLGCVCQVTEDSVNKLSRDSSSFDLFQLEFVPVASCPYVEPGALHYIFLYQYSQQNLAFIAVFMPDLQKACVIVVDPSRTNNLPALGALYAQERNDKLEKGMSSDVIPCEEYDFDIQFEATHKQAYRGIQKFLQQYKDARHGPTTLAYQSTLKYSELLNALPIVAYFPLIQFHVAEPDNMFSTLQWQLAGSKRMIQHSLYFAASIQSFVEMARYYHVPVGNLPRDTTTFGADLFFARHLSRNNHVLWCSPSARPDLGGKEVDDNRLLIDPEKSWEMNVPGCYSSICIELDVKGLAVAALMQSHRIHEHEGAFAAVGFDSVPQLSIDELVGGHSAYKLLASYDETALSAAAFRILKTTVSAWVAAVAEMQNVYADHLIIHFYRWLSSPSSLLFEPAINKTLRGLMEKLFQQLVAELERLNAIVVYANLNRIIVCTRKHKLADAQEYTRFILECIQKKDIFYMLNITLQDAWHFLLWMDPTNFGGIRAELLSEEDIMLSTAQEASDELEDGRRRLVDNESECSYEPVMAFNMTEYLPVGECQRAFTGIISKYITTVFSSVQTVRHGGTVSSGSGPPPLRRIVETQPSQFVCGPVDNTMADELRTEFCREFVTGAFAQDFFNCIDKLRKLLDKRNLLNRPVGFPMLPGSHLVWANPLLEFVKCVCEVVSLDAIVEQEAMKLRRDALRMVGVGEFSDEAQFVDPCLSLLIPEVICRSCNHCRDVDLCRDRDVTDPDKIVDGETVGIWRCVQCDEPYNLDEMESRLVERVHSLVLSCLLQDVKCGRCKEIKQANMSVHCDCAGSYSNMLPVSDLKYKLKAFHNVSRFYGMECLKEALESMNICQPGLLPDT